MTWLLILAVAVLLVGLALLAGGKQASPSPMPPRRRDSGGSGVWVDDYDPAVGLQLDKFGYPVDAVGLISDGDSDFDPDFDPGGGSGGGGGASGSWDDVGGDTGGGGGSGGD